MRACVRVCVCASVCVSVCSLLPLCLRPCSYSLHHFERESPSTDVRVYSAGAVLGDAANAEDPHDVHSMEILRRPDGSTGGRGTERLVSRDRLHGRLPDALLDTYQFWQASPTLIRGYPRKGDAGAAAGDTWIDIRLVPLDPAAVAAASTRGSDGAGHGGVAAGEWGAVVWRRAASLRAKIAAHGGRVPLCAGDQLLLNLVPAQPNTMLWRLRRWAGRLDNLSHVLVWSNSRGKPGDECEITQVDFPRFVCSSRCKASLCGVNSQCRCGAQVESEFRATNCRWCHADAQLGPCGVVRQRRPV